MTRQTKPPQYPSPISIRITPEERNALEKRAAGVTLSTYIRLQLFGEGVSARRTRNRAPVKDEKALAKVLGALGNSRIPNNLNQLAKAVNIGSLPVTPETESALQSACRDIRAIKRLLMTALGIQER